MDIDIDGTYDSKISWKQLKMLTEGVDNHTLQTMVENGTITPEVQKTPQIILGAIQMRKRAFLVLQR